MELRINKVKFRFKLFALSFALLVGFFIPHQTHAESSIADSPCDPDYYKSLSARAWLEAQREITQNQNLILKPDSVFEYTCFDRLVRELADHDDNMLTGTSDYGTPLDAQSLDNSLQDLVGASLIKYIDNNFGSKSSGEAYNMLYGHKAASGINHKPKSITTSGDYNCDVMKRVWKAAKCINFVAYSDYDGFYTFTEYADAGEDKRHLPNSDQACTAIQSSWSDNLSAGLTSGPWANDPLKTYFSLTDADSSCGGTPIPTGVTVLLNDGEDYEEHFCLQPGCHYATTKAGDSTTGCVGK